MRPNFKYGSTEALRTAEIDVLSVSVWDCLILSGREFQIALFSKYLVEGFDQEDFLQTY